MKSSKKSKQVCEQCGSQNIKSRITTYPMKMGEKQVNIGRVAVKECLDCDYLMPTIAGKEKIGRCLGTFIHLFERNAISPV
jgi:NAD-dependent SIR2 family protein deacetylase